MLDELVTGRSWTEARMAHDGTASQHVEILGSGPVAVSAQGLPSALLERVAESSLDTKVQHVLLLPSNRVNSGSKAWSAERIDQVRPCSLQFSAWLRITDVNPFIADSTKNSQYNRQRQAFMAPVYIAD